MRIAYGSVSLRLCTFDVKMSLNSCLTTAFQRQARPAPPHSADETRTHDTTCFTSLAYAERRRRQALMLLPACATISPRVS